MHPQMKPIILLARILLSDKEENMMKTTHLLIIIISFSVFLVQGISLSAQEKNSLDAQFLSPPDEYRSTVLWFWNNGMFNKEGITGDLEELHTLRRDAVSAFDRPSLAPLGDGCLLVFSAEFKDAWKVGYLSVQARKTIGGERGFFAAWEAFNEEN